MTDNMKGYVACDRITFINHRRSRCHNHSLVLKTKALRVLSELFKISLFIFLVTLTTLTGTVALSWLSGLCVPVTPRAMPAGVFTPLVGPPKPERSRSRVQTKDSPTALQEWGLGLRLTTSSCKKNLLRKQQRRQPISCTQTSQGL